MCVCDVKGCETEVNRYSYTHSFHSKQTYIYVHMHLCVCAREFVYINCIWTLLESGTLNHGYSEGYVGSSRL